VLASTPQTGLFSDSGRRLAVCGSGNPFSNLPFFDAFPPLLAGLKTPPLSPFTSPDPSIRTCLPWKISGTPPDGAFQVAAPFLSPSVHEVSSLGPLNRSFPPGPVDFPSSSDFISFDSPGFGMGTEVFPGERGVFLLRSPEKSERTFTLKKGEPFPPWAGISLFDCPYFSLVRFLTDPSFSTQELFFFFSLPPCFLPPSPCRTTFKGHPFPWLLPHVSSLPGLPPPFRLGPF